MKLKEQMEMAKDLHCEFKVLNFDQLMSGEGALNLKMVDFTNHIGCNIDRETNRKQNLKHIPMNFWVKVPNLAIYVNPRVKTNHNEPNSFGKVMSDLKNTQVQQIIQEVVLEFDTNMKLDIEDLKDGSRFIDFQKVYSPERHFVKFEGVLENKFGLADLKAFQKNPKQFIENFDFNYKDWTITDIDNYLDGNPHV